MNTEENEDIDVNTAIADNRAAMTDTVRWMRHMAQAFTDTGNNTFATELRQEAQIIEKSAKHVCDTWGRYLSNEVDKGARMVGETLKAAMTMGTRANDESQ